ncbi:zincin-like metallopeptidase domain-containing protein [Christiangramia marina]|uniref:zincin-like metallopeptidase domain-containing protein n=1 Tax=Christiangramia marina TaxID=409436 RepID=UPI003AA86AA6
MTAVERYNALDGQTATREELQKIAVLGAKQGQTKISLKLFKLLEENEEEEFKIKVGEFALDQVPEDSLKGLDFAFPDEDLEGGLEKAVAPDDIYQMITDKMLKQLEKASGKDYKKKWHDQNDEGYLLPFNFDTKKMYRGINIPLLTEGMTKVLKNPFFLTFNQIEKNKGQLKKGSKGLPVVYFTMLYAVKEKGKDGEQIDFGTYNKKKFLAWLNKNHNKLRYSKDYYKNSYIPILKYYNVFNGADIDGIDFDLKNFKIGYQDGSETIKNNDSRVEIADLIVKNYPSPQPKLLDTKKGGAYYSHNILGTVDEIHMPKFEDFETGLDYYRTLFHEFTHSTGVQKRLDRDMSGKFGSKPYAKEELVAEFGAIFLSAHAGIIWYNQKNHAEYLKNWNSVLTHAKEDNRFIMRAASKAQEAADFILNQDKNGVPAYQSSLKSEPVKKIDRKKSKPSKFKKGEKAWHSSKKMEVTIKKVYIPKKGSSQEKENRVYDLTYSNGKRAIGIPESKLVEVPKSSVSKKPNTNELLDRERKAKLTAKSKADFEKGLKKLGFEIIGYEVNQEKSKNWERSYQLNFKDATGLVLEMAVKPEGKQIEGQFRWNAIGVDAESLVDYKNIQEFYEEILADFQEVFGKASIEEIEDIKKEYSNTLHKKKQPKAQLGLFGAKARKKKGLSNPVAELPDQIEKPVEAFATVPQPVIQNKPVPVKKDIPQIGNPNSLAARMQRNQNRVIQNYKIDNLDIAKFLGEVEIKEKESVGISITAPQGAGKTRFAFQLIDAFAENYKVGHASMEEHPDSSLYTSKAEEYIRPENFVNIDAPDINSMADIHKLILNNDVIVIDSFAKLREIDKNIQVDQDFRKKYDGKLFIFIFQLTSSGKMRGGSKSQFDVDIVLFTEKFDDYRENYIYPDKNRYNKIPPSDLKFNIYNRAMEPIEGNTDVSDVYFEEEKEDPANSRIANLDSGRLIATPIL